MENKKYTRAEIAKIAPNYRGKPENFKPDFRKVEKPQKSDKKDTTPRPEKKEEKQVGAPTPQKNATLWDAAIFGADVTVRELVCFEEHKPSFARMCSIIAETYGSMAADDGTIGKKISKEMFAYYATALLWARLLDIKAKLNQQLTEVEKDYLRMFEDRTFNMPQPVYLFLKGIGCVRDKSGKDLDLAPHTLPVVMAGGKNGYIAAAMDATNHMDFEEIPSLGVCGDVLQAQSTEENLVLGFLSAEVEPTSNMAGYFGRVTPVKEEIKITLMSFGIGARFEENINGTRLNMGLIDYVSAYLMTSMTFRNEAVEIAALTREGSLTQLVKTKPTRENVMATTWVDAVVRPVASFADDLATFGSSYFAGYRLFKEGVKIVTRSQDGGKVETYNHRNWYPITGAIDQGWVETRNARRDGLPAGMDAERFVTVSDSQKNLTVKFIGKMIQANR
uniref:Uncharacterized protein n=1 Tax=Hubei tetragnatha maxillosa virus 9 TaxID=1923251 RepID=A0A1L3KP50_9VIRU|nr:hypothetical protein 5 [Hubei tetragnatha maxillosa virus 9]APG79160.1 hypothetical protein 5 [Hubei tetragnatha maxillosa virus 9]